MCIQRPYQGNILECVNIVMLSRALRAELGHSSVNCKCAFLFLKRFYAMYVDNIFNEIPASNTLIFQYRKAVKKGFQQFSFFQYDGINFKITTSGLVVGIRFFSNSCIIDCITNYDKRTSFYRITKKRVNICATCDYAII